jgi:hypothetical protein
MRMVFGLLSCWCEPLKQAGFKKRGSLCCYAIRAILVKAKFDLVLIKGLRRVFAQQAR